MGRAEIERFCLVHRPQYLRNSQFFLFLSVQFAPSGTIALIRSTFAQPFAASRGRQFYLADGGGNRNVYRALSRHEQKVLIEYE